MNFFWSNVTLVTLIIFIVGSCMILLAYGIVGFVEILFGDLIARRMEINRIRKQKDHSE